MKKRYTVVEASNPDSWSMLTLIRSGSGKKTPYQIYSEINPQIFLTFSFDPFSTLL